MERVECVSVYVWMEGVVVVVPVVMGKDGGKGGGLKEEQFETAGRL